MTRLAHVISSYTFDAEALHTFSAWSAAKGDAIARLCWPNDEAKRRRMAMDIMHREYARYTGHDIISRG